MLDGLTFLQLPSPIIPPVKPSSLPSGEGQGEGKKKPPGELLRPGAECLHRIPYVFSSNLDCFYSQGTRSAKSMWTP